MPIDVLNRSRIFFYNLFRQSYLLIKINLIYKNLVN